MINKNINKNVTYQCSFTCKNKVIKSTACLLKQLAGERFQRIWEPCLHWRRSSPEPRPSLKKGCKQETPWHLFSLVVDWFMFLLSLDSGEEKCTWRLTFYWSENYNPLHHLPSIYSSRTLVALNLVSCIFLTLLTSSFPVFFLLLPFSHTFSLFSFPPFLVIPS